MRLSLLYQIIILKKLYHKLFTCNRIFFKEMIFIPKPISNKTKKLRKMGEGTGKDYLPYITTSEFNSIGTTAVVKDWKTGRGVHCLSQGEALWYYILRWDDSNVDIREQFPLDKTITDEIAKESGFRIPGGEDHIMTTDFLVTKKDNSLQAYSVKLDRNLSDRVLQLLYIEKKYWISQNIPFDILFKTDVNRILASNIRLVTEYYDAKWVFDEYSALKHKIAIKEIVTDMESKELTTEDLKKILEEQRWKM